MGDTPRGQLLVVVKESEFVLEAAFPIQSLDWFTYRYEFIISEFHKMFMSGLLLSSSASIRGTLQVDGDARTF